MFAIAGNSPSGYNLERSLRLRKSASAYLSRAAYSVASAGTQWTISMWVKRGTLGIGNLFAFVATTGAAQQAGIQFDSNNNIHFWQYAPSTYQFRKITTAAFRDVSAWYHLVFVYDTTLATASDRCQVWVNGIRQTAFSTSIDPSLNLVTYFKTGQLYPYIGAENRDNTYLNGFDGYLTEVNFIDGQALTPASFGEFDSTTGVWKPKAYTGSYGANGVILDFEDNSSLTTSSNVGLGKDTSGNGNYWTTNNISITAGVTYDSMTDVPTLTSATAANYAVLNPLENVNSTYMSFKNGNLRADMGTGATTMCWSTVVMPTNKWYWEVTITTVSNGTLVGISYGSNTISDGSAKAISYEFDGNKRIFGAQTSYGSAYTSGDVIGIAVDKAASTITFYKNNVSQGAISDATIATQDYRAMLHNNTSSGSGIYDINFGQRPFAFSPPTGFVALNTFNLPASTIVDGSDNFNIALDTGANIKTASEALYPSNYFEWIKDRANINNHQLIDIVRGSTAVLQSNTTAAETTYTAPSGNSVGYVWKAGGAPVSNTDGTITSTVSVNASAGFSVVTYTGNVTAGATVGHGLGVAPAFVIAKARGSATSWPVYHQSLGASQYILLNTTAAAVSSTQEWGGVAPTSSVITIGNASANNNQATSNVLYAFAQIAGYSAFGKYQGNSSADGVFVYTGFRPKFVVLRPYDGAADWILEDTSRSTFNVSSATLYPNSSGAEASGTNLIDFLSNGFKLRTASGNVNSSSNNYLYAAFAENPFKHSLAR